MSAEPTLLLTVLLAVVTTVISTTFGLLPDRIDLSTVFAAYGAGVIIGELLGTRPGRDGPVLARRWGILLMSSVTIRLVAGLLAD